jgi:hypothetical protein
VTLVSTLFSYIVILPSVSPIVIVLMYHLVPTPGSFEILIYWVSHSESLIFTLILLLFGLMAGNGFLIKLYPPWSRCHISTLNPINGHWSTLNSWIFTTEAPVWSFSYCARHHHWKLRDWKQLKAPICLWSCPYQLVMPGCNCRVLFKGPRIRAVSDPLRNTCGI